MTLNLSEAIDGLPKSFSIFRMPVHQLDAAPGDPSRHRSKCKAINLQVSHHTGHSAALHSYQVVARNPDVVKDQLSCARGTHSAFVFNPLANEEPRCALLH